MEIKIRPEEMLNIKQILPIDQKYHRIPIPDKTSGIYMIKNRIDGKFYIGSSVNLKKRFMRHRNSLNGNNHENTRLNRAWNKHNHEFDFCILEYSNSKEELRKREQVLLDILNPEYNISKRVDVPEHPEWNETQRQNLREKAIARYDPENNHSTKLTWGKVNDLRRLFKETLVSVVDLSTQFGIHRSQVRDIISNKKWRDTEYDSSHVDSRDAICKVIDCSQRKGPHISEQTELEIINDRKAGARMTDLIEKYGISHYHIRNILVKVGVLIKKAHYLKYLKSITNPSPV